jgi:plasmid stabilization system protein ParE
MKLVFTDEAKIDLVEIGRWIARHNPARAPSFVDEIIARCIKLAGIPHAYPLIPRHGNSSLRRVGQYVVVYRITTDAVEIVHVLHGARDVESILFPELKKE